MPEQPAPDTLAGLLIYDGDELIFDRDDPSTYIICNTSEDLQRAFASLNTGPGT